MQDRLQPLPLGGIGEYPPAHTGAIQVAVCGQAVTAKAGNYCIQGRLPRFHQRVRDPVRVNDRYPEGLEAFRHRGFAAADATGEADYQGPFRPAGRGVGYSAGRCHGCRLPHVELDDVITPQQGEPAGSGQEGTEGHGQLMVAALEEDQHYPDRGADDGREQDDDRQ